MLQLLSRYRGIVVVGALLMIPLVLLYAQTKKPGARGPVVGLVLDVAGGIERLLLWSVGGTADLLEHYVTSVASYDELTTLRRSETSSRQLMTRVRELEIENDEIRGLARALERIDGPRPVGARVIARAGRPVTNSITINLGSGDGVRRGDGVVDRDGAVGIVFATGRTTSDVLLLTDPKSSIDIVVQRSRARGVLHGDDSDARYAAKVEDFDRLRDVRAGDMIVTSGIGTRFPVGLPVGKVVDADAPDDGLYLRARIAPAVDFARLEWVGVLVNREPPRPPRLGSASLDEDIPETLALDAGPSPAPRASAPRAATSDGGVVAPDAGAAVDAGAAPSSLSDSGVIPSAAPAVADAGPTAGVGDGGSP